MIYSKTEKTARIISHAHKLNFEVLNQTRLQLLEIREVLSRDKNTTVLIHLEGGKSL
jgi:hypothetical protein